MSTIQTRKSSAVASTTADTAPAYAMVIATGTDEHVVAGSNVDVTFQPVTPGPPIAGLAQVQEGHYVNGTWVPGRWLNGDDILLNDKLAEAAATNQSGSGLLLAANQPYVRKVKLYRYR